MAKSAAEKVRTVGGYQLARTGKAQTQIGVEIGVSKVTVHQWISGEKRPARPSREKLKATYGIDETSWDEKYEPEPKIAAPELDGDSGVELVEGDEAMQMAKALQRQLRAQLDDLEMNGDDWTPAEKAQVTQRLASSVNVLAKTTGQYELGRRLMQLPIWKRIEAEIFEALKPFPEAAKAVEARFDAFERAWLGKVS